jgi:arsenate reductase
MTIKLYGIPNCDTVRKARAWLKEKGQEHVFHDFRKDGLTETHAVAWTEQFAWKELINARGTTWRRLSEDERAVTNEREAHALMLAHPSVIRRPLVEVDGRLLLIGFDAPTWQTALALS